MRADDSAMAPTAAALIATAAPPPMARDTTRAPCRARALPRSGPDHPIVYFSGLARHHPPYSAFCLNIEVTPTLILTGSSAFVTLWILSSIVSAIDSVPLLPKFLELVGTGYSIWFTARYLLYKESRDDLFGKFEDLKQRII